MADQSAIVCRHVIYQGRVQGVGFRWTASRIAKPYQVAGFVRNLADGTVELHIQGSAGVVSAFLDELGRVLSANIDRADITEESVQVDLSGFAIRG